MILLPIFLFPTYMGMLMIGRATKTLDSLDHVKGVITNLRFIKHERKRKFQTYYEDVLVLNIEGAFDEFGFIGSNYQKLHGMRFRGRTADIYYDSEAQRIEEEITLHIFDMKIDNYRAVSIDEISRNERLGAVGCFALSTVVLTVMILGVVRIGRNKL